MEDNSWEGPLQEFRHAELRSNTCIRLIQIHAGLFRGDISCTLQHYETDTQTCPDYAALSYVWGDSTPTHTIYVNGLVYRVHQSLWKFLNHSRTKENMEHTWIWTDLLCIDQAHHSEKNEQIARMGDIYAQAAHVVSWLGNRKKTAKALRTLVEMSKEISPGFTPKFALNSPESEQIHKACCQLALQEPYWERVWIMQEVACARHCVVVCGDVSVDFEDLSQMMQTAMKRFVRFLDRRERSRIMVHVEALPHLRTSIQQGKTMKFLGLIEKTRFCHATREQDRIYGLLGMASRLDPGLDSLALDVSQHKSLNDVWWDIIFMIVDGESIVSIENDLAILHNLSVRLPPPSRDRILEMGSSTRKSCAETASRVSEAAYSKSIQEFMGISSPDIFPNMRFNSYVWQLVTTHVSNHENDVPGLRTRLGWSAYAGLRFTSLYHIDDEGSQKLDDSLPLGWFCAAHWPDPLERTTAKHLFESRPIRGPPKHRDIPAYCSGAEHDGPRCDLSLVVLRIEPLGVTCIVRSTDATQIDFYCDCCDPSAASAEPPPFGQRNWRDSFLPTPIPSVDTPGDLMRNSAGVYNDLHERGEVGQGRSRKKRDLSMCDGERESDGGSSSDNESGGVHLDTSSPSSPVFGPLRE